ncbi:dTDP-4-dehydrorhamnose reductase [Azotobacter chroococcum]|uniref:dTDP-4-dehydrorhamnose reductase n=1 Tax=Azotobacter chroococcum NCIMB 8003 TaxID=1328314 RepID=A0A0C4WNG5_9GAMM|nr:dTDP-4-dehydrorhamnose reductase [Azotobacter chroococcum]AJE22094.1 dTDP-4-dehydrorhamnose reductase [Azotobacter chroococcum NCIMB 8003]
MRILLLGKNGQVGWELQRALAPLGELVALDRHGERGLCGDLADLDALAATVREIAPDAIVNAAAYTAVDKAESEPELALRINGEAPGVLAREAARLGAWLVHYSTDYVFDGSGESPWREDAPTGPLSVYGRSKLAGELAIAASGARALVFRTSWVYAARGGNFAKTMLRLARERDQLRVIADQIGAPTGAELIADVTAHALRQAMGSADASPLGGVYHLAAAGETSWFDYARFVLLQAEQAGEVLKVGHGQIEAIPTSAYPTPAQRPLNSRLDTTKLQETFGLHLPNWQDGVARMLTETTKD